MSLGKFLQRCLVVGGSLYYLIFPERWDLLRGLSGGHHFLEQGWISKAKG